MIRHIGPIQFPHINHRNILTLLDFQKFQHGCQLGMHIFGKQGILNPDQLAPEPPHHFLLWPVNQLLRKLVFPLV